MDFATRKHYYNLCDPFESLPPDDPRNLDLDDYAKVRVRGFRWVERLADRIELSQRPVFSLFTGLPGSGKTTELRRLTKRLGSREGANLLPVLVDGEQVVDLANPVDIPDILAAILHGAEECVLQAEGRDPQEALQDTNLTRLWNWLTRTDVELNKAEYSIPAGPKLVMEMKTRPSLRERVRNTVAAHLTTFLSQVREEMQLLNDRARAAGYSDLIIIFDSLEKLRGMSTNWNEVLASAERIFAAGAPYLRLPVHVLYTIPPALVTRGVSPVDFMPMIKLREPDGSPFPPGIAAARELIRRRVPDEVLTDLLGSHTEERITELIRWSGGYPREIVRLLQSAIAVPETPLSDEDLAHIVGEIKSSYRMMVTADAFDWLARVARDHFLTIQTDGHRQAADLMLRNNVVLQYLNGDYWWDLHPAVYEIPGVEEAKRALEQRLQGEDPVG